VTGRMRKLYMMKMEDGRERRSFVRVVES